MLDEVLQKYGVTGARVEPLGDGLINSTWKIIAGEQEFVLQKINTVVFKVPENIDSNLNVIDAYLNSGHPGYKHLQLVIATDGNTLVKTGGVYFRMFYFISNSYSINVLNTPEQAFESAAAFGRFTKKLSGVNLNDLKVTLNDFHNLELRYEQFRDALQNDNKTRLALAEKWIESAEKNSIYVKTYRDFITNQDMKLRVTHHDTKISNVLFDNAGKAICVIDLDTVMPGYFISDLGDMMRTYLCPVSEEEVDYSEINARPAYYKAVINGYLSEMGELLTSTEQAYIHYSGCFMIYMQALRFLTDYLNKDIYYWAKYEDHNLIRAGNQFTLLEKFNDLANM